MAFAGIGAGLLAGVLSTLSPCVFPLLPLVVGAATASGAGGAWWLAAGVATAFTAAGLLVATVGFAVGLDGDVFRAASALMLVLVGLVLLSPAAQARLSMASGGLGGAGDRLIRRLSPGGGAGQFAVGALLGLVWTPCVGPTLGAASVLAARQTALAGVAAVMFAFGVGSTLPMLAVAGLSRAGLRRWRPGLLSAGRYGKATMGVCALLVGLAVLSGLDRRLETVLVAASPPWLTDLTTAF